MNKFGSIEQNLGADGKVKGSVGVEGADLKVQAEISYPVEKIITPVFQVVDSLIDKLEALIPGDQKALAAGAKSDAREAILKAIGNLGTQAQAEVQAPQA